MAPQCDRAHVAKDEQSFSNLKKENNDLKTFLNYLLITNSSLCSDLTKEKSSSKYFKEQLTDSSLAPVLRKELKLLGKENQNPTLDKSATEHLVKEVRKERKKVVSHGKAVTRLTVELKRLQEENARLSGEAAKVPELKSDIQKLQDELVEAQKIAANLIEQLITFPELNSQLHFAKLELQKLAKEKASLMNDLWCVRSDLTAAKRQIRNMQHEESLLSSLKREIDDLLQEKEESFVGELQRDSSDPIGQHGS